MIKLYQNSQKQTLLYKNNKGQTLIEFVLLITSVMLISLLFLQSVNGSLADMWLEMGNILTENPQISLELK